MRVLQQSTRSQGFPEVRSELRRHFAGVKIGLLLLELHQLHHTEDMRTDVCVGGVFVFVVILFAESGAKVGLLFLLFTERMTEFSLLAHRVFVSAEYFG